jgi:choline dehydrogenase-like flavoprotein
MKEHFDIIIVGTGFASTFFLKRFIEKFGESKRILVLERGDLFRHVDRVKHMRDRKPFENINWEKSSKLVLNETPDKPWIFDPNFGGGSNCWTGCTPRFMPNDFRMKSQYGVGVDWPLTYNDLEPYYSKVEDMMMIAGPDVTPFPKSKPYPLKPHALSNFDRLIQKKYNELYISQPTARPTSQVGNRPKCCSSVVCNLCPIDSKFTIENTFSDLYSRPNISLRYNASVHSLRIENNVAKAVVYRVEDEDIEVTSDIVVLGANAIFNAHILLNSGDSSYFTGRGLSEQAGTYAFFYLDNVNNVGGGSIIPANGYMMYDVPERSEYSGCLIESHNTVYIRSEVGKWRHIAKMKFVFENLPSDNNRVMLSENPLVPKIVFSDHSNYAKTALDNLEKNVSQYFQFFPIEKIHYDGFFQKSEYHICCTTRMSSLPNDGVVDENLIHHQYRNVFVLGSGAFPTMSPANPTLTISALSLRAVDKVFNNKL